MRDDIKDVETALWKLYLRVRALKKSGVPKLHVNTSMLVFVDKSEMALL
jgi:hypothetical protein